MDEHPRKTEKASSCTLTIGHRQQFGDIIVVMINMQDGSSRCWAVREILALSTYRRNRRRLASGPVPCAQTLERSGLVPS